MSVTQVDTGEPETVAAEGSPSTVRRIMRIVVWAAAVSWALFTGWRLLGGEPFWIVVVALPYTPYVALGTVVPIALAVAFRVWRPLPALGFCLLALTVVVSPRAFADTQPTVEGPQVTVMSTNMRLGGSDVSQIVELVRRHEVDVLSIQELTPVAERELAEAGLTQLLPQQEVQSVPGAEGTGVYTRFDLEVLPQIEGIFHMPHVRLTVPGAAPIEFVAVHPAAPYAAHMVPDWHADLGSLPAADNDGTLRILAGDFNATLDHATLRRLVDTGYTDAAETTGSGLTGTWQMTGAVTGLVPPVVLDHVLVDSRIAVDGYSVHGVRGTDHRALVVSLRLP